MSEKSKIQWTDATWNIARGCTKVDEDCKFCYMYRDSFNSSRYDPLQIVRTKTVFNIPLRIKEPSKIFTSSLTDVFHEAIDGYRNEVWDIIRKCPQHIFQILTKRPERIIDNLPPFWDEIKKMTIIKNASVKVMLSYDYSHFEVSMSLENESGLSTHEIDDARKKCQRLADKAVSQYKTAKSMAQKRNNSEHDKNLFLSQVELIKRKPEGDRTINEMAILKQYEDESWQKNFYYEYDYDDDDQYNY